MITLMRPEHLRDAVELMREMHSVSRVAHVPFSADRVLQLFNLAETTELVRGFVVLDDHEQMIGICVMAFDMLAFSNRKGARDLCLYIKPAYRSVKLFRTLMQAVEQWCEGFGVDDISFELSASLTDEELLRTERAFRMIGYKRAGIVVNKELGDGAATVDG
jgi:GNAT superfamily N-acetyltransferase